MEQYLSFLCTLSSQATNLSSPSLSGYSSCPSSAIFQRHSNFTVIKKEHVRVLKKFSHLKVTNNRMLSVTYKCYYVSSYYHMQRGNLILVWSASLCRWSRRCHRYPWNSWYFCMVRFPLGSSSHILLLLLLHFLLFLLLFDYSETKFCFFSSLYFILFFFLHNAYRKWLSAKRKEFFVYIYVL